MKTWRSVWPRIAVLGLVVVLFATSADAERRQEKKRRGVSKRVAAIQSVSEVWETVLAGREHLAFRALDRLSEELREEPEKTEEAVAVLREVRLYLAQNREADDARILLCRLRAILGAPVGPTVAPATTLSADAPSSDIQPPVRIYSPQPVYTEMARRSRVQGVVISRLKIDQEGCVVDYSTLQSLVPELDESTRLALLTWVLRPAELDGRGVMIYHNFTTNFQLQ